ncbi:MAG: UDP-N-acetylmuramoyl-L-alanine--D-glutamate ligase [Cyanobacteria bacterium P01_F01_bin.42]
MSAAHVIGLGRSGVASARLLAQDGWSVTLSDAGNSAALQEKKSLLEAEGIRVLLGTKFSLSQLHHDGEETPQQIIVSPGVPWDLPTLVAARLDGIEMMGEMELAWRHLKHFPWIGITGTNGKTTTTALTAAILKAAGWNAPACGNIGYSACELALRDEAYDWIVAEVSSYQIESASTLAPQIGIWTTFTPDHLERHKTISYYRAIKAALIDQSHHKILNGDDSGLRQSSTGHWSQAWWTLAGDQMPDIPTPTATIQDGWVMIKDQPILSVDRLKMPGRHNRQNMLLAVSAAFLAGADPEAIAEGVANFPGVPHRLEYVGTLHGAIFINDSKATNYDAALTGLAAVEGPVILIAGGEPKKGDDTQWIKAVQGKVCQVLLIGEAAPQFAERLQQFGFEQHEIVETMENAVSRAVDLVSSLQAKSVLLSPACASFDQYPNFEKRGDHYKELCQNYFQA